MANGKREAAGAKAAAGSVAAASAAAGSVAGARPAAARPAAAANSPAAASELAKAGVLERLRARRDNHRPAEEARPPAPWGTFLRAAVPDFLLTLLVSVGLVLTVSFGFESVPDVRSNVGVICGLVAPMLIIQFMGSRSRSAVLPAGIAAAVWAAVLIGGAVALTPADVPLFVDGTVNDAPESYLLFVACAIVVPVLVFLLSRRTVGMAFLLVGAVIACAWVQFLYRDWADNHGLAVSLAVYFGIAMMFVFQTYRSSLLSAKRAKKTSFLTVIGFAVGVAAVCAGVGVALFYGVIAPNDMSTADVRPFQRYYSVPVVEYSGVYSTVEVEDPNQTSDDTNDDKKDTNQDAQGGPDQTDSEEAQANPQSPVQQFLSQFDSDSWTQTFDAINYERLAWGAIIAALCIAALLAGIVLARRSMRERRLAKIADKPADYQVLWIYNFLCSRFKRLKVERPETLTPMEFALGSQRRLVQFAQDTGAGVDFVRVTDIYQRSCFGGQQPTDQELADVKTYYRAFFKNARRYVGNIRWIWKFWRV